MKELTAEYHRRLRIQQDRAHKMEQDMRARINSLQRDNQSLAAERDELLAVRESNSSLNEQLKQLRRRNDEMSSKLAKISCDCELLRQTERETKLATTQLNEQIAALRADNMNLRNELDDKARQLRDREAIHTRDSDKRALENVISQKDACITAERERFDKERKQWEEEKRKVLQYQKQLQLNYIQMCRRNNELEGSPTQSSRSHNNNNSPRMDTALFKLSLDSKPESLC